MDYPVINAPKSYEKWLSEICLGSAGPRPSVIGMRKKYWGDAPIVRCGQYIYCVSPSAYREIQNGRLYRD